MTHANDKKDDPSEPQTLTAPNAAMNEALKLFCADYFSDKFLFTSASEPRQLKTLCTTFGDFNHHHETAEDKTHTNKKTNQRGNTTC